MMIPSIEQQAHLAPIAQLLRPGLSPAFRCDAQGALYYDQYRETVRTTGFGGSTAAAHPVTAGVDLAVMHDPHTTLTVAISTPCDDSSQASPSFGLVLARLATQLGYNYFQTWETATLIQRRHVLHAGDTATRASRRVGNESCNDAGRGGGNGSPGACQDQISRFWVSRIVPFLCLPVVRVEDFDDDNVDDDNVDVDDDSDDIHDSGNHHRRSGRSNNNSRRNNYGNDRRRHYYNYHSHSHNHNNGSPGSGSAVYRDNDNDDFHRRLEQAAANLVHGGLFTLRRHGHGPSNWTTSATIDTTLFTHRPHSHVPYTRLMEACARVQQTFNALALQVVTDTRLQEASGLCVTERRLFAQCVERAYKRLGDVLCAECIAGEGGEIQQHCLWSKGLNGWIAVGQSKQDQKQQNGNGSSPGSGSSSSSSSYSSGISEIFDGIGVVNEPQNMTVRDVIEQCGPNTCFRRFTLQRDDEHWLVLVNEQQQDDEFFVFDDMIMTDIDARGRRRRHAGVALVASVKKDKVTKSGVVVLPDVKRFLDLTADVELMLHADSGPVREMVAADLRQAGVLCNGDVVKDAGIVTREDGVDEDEIEVEIEDEEGNAVLDAWAFPTSGSRRGRK